MRLIALTSLVFVAACSGGPSTPPLPSNPEDSVSIVSAARQCDVSDFGGRSPIEIAQPDYGGQPSAAAVNQLEGELYIEAVQSQPCVYTLPSGLNFRILRAAGNDAPIPASGEMVRVNYEGQSISGETFDSSYQRGIPADFPSNRLIAGWVEALSLMRAGEEWELYIPAELAYGQRGTPGGPIGPSQTLYFRMELICLPGREDGGCED